MFPLSSQSGKAPEPLQSTIWFWGKMVETFVDMREGGL